MLFNLAIYHPMKRFMGINHYLNDMKKISLLVMFMFLVGIISCRDTQKEQEELDKTLDTIESVEQEIDETVEEVEKKAEEVESALKQLDSI